MEVAIDNGHVGFCAGIVVAAAPCVGFRAAVAEGEAGDHGAARAGCDDAAHSVIAQAALHARLAPAEDDGLGLHAARDERDRLVRDRHADVAEGGVGREVIVDAGRDMHNASVRRGIDPGLNGELRRIRARAGIGVTAVFGDVNVGGRLRGDTCRERRRCGECA